MSAPSEKDFELSITVGDASFSATGPADLVKESFADFKELLDKGGSAGSKAGSGARTGKRNPRLSGNGPRSENGRKTEEAVQRDPVDASKMTLPQLLNETGFEENPEVGAAIVIWAHDHEGKEAVTRAEIETYWKGTTRKVPKNLSRDLSKAVKKGWISRGKDGLSPEGYGRPQLGIK